MTFDGTFDSSEVDDSPRKQMPEDGCHLASVATAEIKVSKDDDGYISVTFTLPESGDWRVFDIVMLSGKGAGIGAAKSKALGHPLEHGQPVLPAIYVGCQVKLWLKVEQYDGKDRLKVDISRGTYCGYDPVMPVDDDGEIIPF